MSGLPFSTLSRMLTDNWSKAAMFTRLKAPNPKCNAISLQDFNSDQTQNSCAEKLGFLQEMTLNEPFECHHG